MLKMVIIGGGSANCPGLINRLCGSRILRKNLREIILFDIDRPRAERIKSFCQKVAEKHGCTLNLSVVTENEAEIAKRIQIDSIGVNHFSFFRRFQFEGKDVTGQVIDFVTRPPRKYDLSRIKMLSAYPELAMDEGLFPGWHWKFRKIAEEDAKGKDGKPLGEVRAVEVQRWEKQQLEMYERKDLPIDEIIGNLSKRSVADYSLMAVSIPESMIKKGGSRQVIGVKNAIGNQVCIPWLERESYIEVPCLIGRNGVRFDRAMEVGLPVELKLAIIREVETQNLFIRSQFERSAESELEALEQHPLIGKVLRQKWKLKILQAALDPILPLPKIA